MLLGDFKLCTRVINIIANARNLKKIKIKGKIKKNYRNMYGNL